MFAESSLAFGPPPVGRNRRPERRGETRPPPPRHPHLGASVSAMRHRRGRRGRGGGEAKQRQAPPLSPPAEFRAPSPLPLPPFHASPPPASTPSCWSGVWGRPVCCRKGEGGGGARVRARGWGAHRSVCFAEIARVTPPPHPSTGGSVSSVAAALARRDARGVGRRGEPRERRRGGAAGMMFFFVRST
jgi:hypothetical protein